MEPDNPYATPEATPTPPILPEAALVIPAGHGPRFLNSLVDGIVMFVLALIFGIIWGVLFGLEHQLPPLIGFLINVSLGVGYYTIMEGFTGKTIGKLLTGTKVVDSTGGPPSIKTAFLRSLCRYIPFEPFSFLSSDARGWHDSITKTWVIKSR